MYQVYPMEHSAAEVSSSLACRLLTAVGNEDFLHELLQAVNVLVPTDFVSMFLFSESCTPVFLGTESRHALVKAKHAARIYTASCFNDDPNVGILRRDSRADRLVSYQTREDVRLGAYRLNCYELPGILDRFSAIARTRRGVAMTLSFYRGEQLGPLSEGEFDRLMSHAPLIINAAQRHVELSAPGQDDYPALLPRVVERFPALTKREAQVCAGILAGWTQEQIAAHLGIKKTSVITHRRKAYQRLSVADQRDLIRLWFAH